MVKLSEQRGMGRGPAHRAAMLLIGVVNSATDEIPLFFLSDYQARSSAGEHFPDAEGVGGSIPPVPTKPALAPALKRQMRAAPIASVAVLLQATWI